MKIKRFVYSKENGDVSNRHVIIVSEPRENFLVYDMSDLTEDQIVYLEKALKEAEDYRDDCLVEFEQVTGIKINDLWRSFKPGGIEWTK